MEHVVCAVFDNPRDADEAIVDLVDVGLDFGLVSAIVHGDEFHHEDMDGPQTKVRERAIGGGLLAGGLGALVASLVAGPIGMIGAGPLAAAMFGVGATYGGLGGALTGRDTTRNRLQEIVEDVEPGQVLLAVTTKGEALTETAETILEDHGGHEVDVIV